MIFGAKRAIYALQRGWWNTVMMLASVEWGMPQDCISRALFDGLMVSSEGKDWGGPFCNSL
jgi:hypothetical protein